MPDIEGVAIIDFSNSYTIAHLFKFDSVHGKYIGYICVEDIGISIYGKMILCYSEYGPCNLPGEIKY